MLHPLPLPLSSCLGCIPPLIGLPSLRFYAVGSSLFLLSVCFCLCSLFYRDDVLCWLLLARPFLYAFHAHLRFPVDLVWFRLSCDHGWIRSGSVNVRKQQQQQQSRCSEMGSCTVDVRVRHCGIQGRGTTDGEGSNWKLEGPPLSEARKEDPVGSWSLGRPSAEAATSEAGP